MKKNRWPTQNSKRTLLFTFERSKWLKVTAEQIQKSGRNFEEPPKKIAPKWTRHKRYEKIVAVADDLNFEHTRKHTNAHAHFTHKQSFYAYRP